MKHENWETSEINIDWKYIIETEHIETQWESLEITENHAASSSQLHLQAVWHVAKLQVHGRGQVAIKSVVLWGNVTLHKDDEESEVHARSLSHPAMQTHLLKLLAHGCEHRHPAVLDLGLTAPASAQMLAKLFFWQHIKHIIQLLLPARHGISINPASWRPQDRCPWKDQGGPRSRQVPGHPQGLRSLSMLLLRAENRHQQSSSTLQDTHQISSAFSVAFQIYAKVI